MAWFADLAGRAESLLNNLDEQTGAALRNHSAIKTKNNDKRSTHNITPNNIQNNENNQKRSPPPRLGRKSSVVTDRTATTQKKSSLNTRSHSPINDVQERPSRPRRKSPARKPALQPFSLNHCPRTLVGDMKETPLSVSVRDSNPKQRRNSYPIDLELINVDSVTYKMQNLEVENAMLRNELNVINREVTELLGRLRKTEDDLNETQLMLEKSQVETERASVDKDTLQSQLEQLKIRINGLMNIDMPKYRNLSQTLDAEVNVLRQQNSDLENRVKELTEKNNVTDGTHTKLESDYRHAQTVIAELQNELTRSTGECSRLEKDWETYKLRVKSMLFAKDNEIKALQAGLNQNDDTKLLVEELESLKEEKEKLSDLIGTVRKECDDMKQNIEQFESRHKAAERVVAALRDALREERNAKNRTETQCMALGKQIKAMEIEMGQTVASLRTALRDKENELHRLRESASSIRTTDTSALNVADYEVMHDAIDNEKLHYLTETLVQKQGKIDALMADNNMLKIQLDKLQSKYKTEMSSMKNNNAHSVVQFQDGDCRNRTRSNGSPSVMSKLSLRVGVTMKRYPIFRVFIFIYMIGLHLWVLTVLFTSTPENILTRPTKL